MSSRHVPHPDDQLAWQCSNGGHWNKRSEKFCRECREPSPWQGEENREALRRIHEEHPRSNESD